MSRSAFRRPHLATIGFLAGLMLAMPAARAQLEVIGTYYRPDQPFPEFNAFWTEGSIEVDQEAAGDQADYVRPPQDADQAEQVGESRRAAGNRAGRQAANAARPTRADGREATVESAEGPLGGSAHVFVTNTGSRAVKVQDVHLGGISLNEAITFSDQRIRKKFASIFYSKLGPAQTKRLVAHGEPIWWKVDPPEIAPGTTAEIIVRLRQKPEATVLPVGLIAGTATVQASVPVSDPAPRLEGLYFAPDLTEAYLYLRHPAGKGTAPRKIMLDGKDITARCEIARDAALDLTPIIARFDPPLARGGFHVFAAEYEDGQVAMSGLRAWSDEFVYGVFGGKPGKDGDLKVGRQYVDDLLSHNLNMQMPQIGSAAVQSFFKDPAGREYLEKQGFRMVLPHPGKFGIDEPFAIYVHDEPDCGDYRAEGLAENKKIGALARWVISHGDELRAQAPRVPHMVNLNMTYKPHNWHVYGQIPDIFTVDPYYQVRLKDAYQKRPERIPLYSKATYIYMVSAVAQSAGAPNPLHVILYSNKQLGRDEQSKPFRFPTPVEKRIEVYYAVAAGAKGLSYWWYTPGKPAYGLGAATANPPDPDAQALWREIGLIGAEVRTAGDVLLTSCPIEMPVQAPGDVWVRCLARGHDTLVLLAVNENYRNTDQGTDFTPVQNANVTVKLPAWIKQAQTFEISAAGTKAISARQTNQGLRVALGGFDATKMIVITADPGLQTRLQRSYDSKLAANTAVLLREHKPIARGR